MNGPSTDYPSSRYAWYVTFVLLVANVVSFVDRQIISLLIEPIKADLHLSDTQISVLHGFAFAIFYAVMGIPLGRLADRRNRSKLIAIGIAFWSLMTAACGLAKGFAGFFAARIGVGVGEATLAPCAYSMTSDNFPPDRRSKPISLIAMGPYLGGGLSFILGGLVVHAVSTAGLVSLPVVGTLQPWQLTFIIVGLPGVLVSALVLATVREPERHDRISDTAQGLPFSETISFIKENRRVITTVTMGYSITAMLGYGLLAWIPSLFIRRYGWSAGDVGLVFGLIVLFFGSFGTIMGGVWADYLTARERSDSYVRVSMYAAIGLVCFVAAPLMPTPTTTLVLLAPTMFFLGCHIGVGMAAITQITPNEFRGQITAIYLFALVLIGAGVGPFLVALFTDRVFENELDIHRSLALFGAIFVPVAFALFASVLKPFATMLTRIRQL